MLGCVYPSWIAVRLNEPVSTTATNDRSKVMRMQLPAFSLPSIVLLLALVAVLSGCDRPFYGIPGGAFDGRVEASAPSDWSSLQDGVFQMETSPDDPYSVEINDVVRNGGLYIDPAEGRAWLANIRADSRVCARIDGRIYLLQAVLVRDPEELAGFEADRFVHRLQPRSTTPAG